MDRPIEGLIRRPTRIGNPVGVGGRHLGQTVERPKSDAARLLRHAHLARHNAQLIQKCFLGEAIQRRIPPHKARHLYFQVRLLLKFSGHRRLARLGLDAAAGQYPYRHIAPLDEKHLCSIL